MIFCAALFERESQKKMEKKSEDRGRERFKKKNGIHLFFRVKNRHTHKY